MNIGWQLVFVSVASQIVDHMLGQWNRTFINGIAFCANKYSWKIFVIIYVMREVLINIISVKQALCVCLMLLLLLLSLVGDHTFKPDQNAR